MRNTLGKTYTRRLADAAQIVADAEDALDDARERVSRHLRAPEAVYIGGITFTSDLGDLKFYAEEIPSFTRVNWSDLNHSIICKYEARLRAAKIDLAQVQAEVRK